MEENSGYVILAALLVGCVFLLIAAHYSGYLQKRRIKTSWLRRVLSALFLVSIIACIANVLIPGECIISNNVIFSFVSLLGIGFTIFALFFAYEQFKMQEDRIDGYNDFYKAAIALLKDKDGKFVHFSGTTLIPGHISFGDKKYVSEYGDYVKVLVERTEAFHKITKKKESSKLILPEKYQLAYNKYLNKKYKNHGEGDNFNGTANEINEKKLEIESIEKKVNHCSLIKKMTPIKLLSSKTTESLCAMSKVKLNVVEKDDPFLNNFYLSNGKTIIYAISITHEQAQIINDDEEPIFVGFKTQKTSIIKEFEKRFDRQWDDIENTNEEPLVYSEYDTTKQRRASNVILYFIRKLSKVLKCN